MALQYVGGTSGVGTSTGYTVSLSGTLTGGIGTSPQAGDIVVVASAFGNTASSAPAISGNSSGAYQTLGAAVHANDTWDTEFRAFYQVMGATPDTTLTVTRVTNAAYGGGTVVHVWRGQHSTTPINVTGTPASGGNASQANPPAVTPTASGAVVIAMGAGTQGTTGAAFTIPSGMTNGVSIKGDGTTSDIGVFMASFAWTSGSYDPAAATGGTTSTSSSWAAQTIALAPQPPTSTGSGAITESGTDSASASGTVSDPAITGSGAVSETGTDAPVGSGRLLVQGLGAVTEQGVDAAAASGVLVASLLSGSASLTEVGTDVASGAGGVASAPITGTVALSEAGDAAAGTGVVPIVGSGAVAESGQDTALASSQSAVSSRPGFEMGGRKVYIKRGKRIHIFDTVEDADAWVEAEEQAQQAIQTAKGKKKVKAKAKVYKALDEQLPHEVIRLDWLESLIAHFNIPVELPTLEARQDWLEVARIALLAQQMQDDEEVELLLLS